MQCTTDGYVEPGRLDWEARRWGLDALDLSLNHHLELAHERLAQVGLDEAWCQLPSKEP